MIILSSFFNYLKWLFFIFFKKIEGQIITVDYEAFGNLDQFCYSFIGPILL